jgi:general stress protein 26
MDGDIEQALLQYTSQIVLCTVTTVSPSGQPRSRMLHPVFEVLDGLPVGWVCTGRTPVKVADLAHEPRVAVTYWSPSNDTVLMECRASWVESLEDKQHVWDLFMRTPPPLGYDVSSYGSPSSASFTPLRLDPTRVQVMAGTEYPFGDLRGRVWRRPDGV